MAGYREWVRLQLAEENEWQPTDILPAEEYYGAYFLPLPLFGGTPDVQYRESYEAELAKLLDCPAFQIGGASSLVLAALASFKAFDVNTANRRLEAVNSHIAAANEERRAWLAPSLVPQLNIYEFTRAALVATKEKASAAAGRLQSDAVVAALRRLEATIDGCFESEGCRRYWDHAVDEDAQDVDADIDATESMENVNAQIGALNAALRVAI
ncbi:hypothetical protein [Nereida ignava]|uniref:hypothetical protein n=1 Tax=Nereida ignava TaxID=282199 RepID=UPI0030F77A37